MINVFDYITDLNTDDAYALVMYEGKVEPVFFHLYGDMGQGMFLGHSPCCNPVVVCTFSEEEQKNIRGVCIEGILPGLLGTPDIESCEKFFDDFVKNMIIDGVLYEIPCFQCAPYLPEEVDEIKIMTEGEMLRWLLENKQD